MIMRTYQFMLATVVLLASSVACSVNGDYQQEFDLDSCNLVTEGRNTYFIMEPGYRLVLEEDEELIHVTVLDETKMVDGIETRVIEEREWDEGELYEISLNYFAMCEDTKDVYYFGEGVDYYEGEEVIGHDGAWIAGVGENKPGLIMPGTPVVGMKYYQEIAPGIAMDRGEIMSLDETCETPAGTFSDCLKIKEGTALNFLETEYKYYAPDIGMIRDEDLKLIEYGFVDE